MIWPKLGLAVMFTLGLLSMFPLVTVREPFMKQVLHHERNATDSTAGMPANVTTVASRAWCAKRSTTTMNGSTALKSRRDRIKTDSRLEDR